MIIFGPTNQSLYTLNSTFLGGPFFYVQVVVAIIVVDDEKMCCSKKVYHSIECPRSKKCVYKSRQDLSRRKKKKAFFLFIIVCVVCVKEFLQNFTKFSPKNRISVAVVVLFWCFVQRVTTISPFKLHLIR